jgi:hemolysin III
MSARTLVRTYSVGEEVANSLTHGFGIVLSVVGLAVLVVSASASGDVRHVVSCAIFGVTLILLYTASTLYHGIQHSRVKAAMRVLDHSAIFLLIAGTYTPFTLVNLRGPWGWSLFGLIWGLALLGVLFQVTLLRRWVGLSLGLYVGMGWAVIVAAKPLLETVPPQGLALLLLGGLSYTGGIVFYVWHRLPYHHAVWHLFVLAGSVCHFCAILFYVAPIRA